MKRKILDWLNPAHAGGLDWGHLALMLACVSLVTYIIGFASGAVVTYYVDRHGGFQKGPLPPTQRVIGGPPLPASYSLQPYLSHIALQGGNSCVSQSIAQMVSIEEAEGGHRASMAGEYIYGILSPGADDTLTYQDAMNTLASDGMATYAAWPHEGDTYGVYPPYSVMTGARPRTIRSWYSLGPQDYASIEQEVHAGRPVAIAISVYSSFLATGVSYWSGQYGGFQFDHSILVIGWDTQGLQIVNSWGSQWGDGGLATLSWGFLSTYAFAAVGADPVFSIHRPAPKLFPVTLWNRNRQRRHEGLVRYRIHGSLTWQARTWLAYGPRRAGSVVTVLHYIAGHWWRRRWQRPWEWMRFEHAVWRAWPEWHRARMTRRS